MPVNSEEALNGATLLLLIRLIMVIIVGIITRVTLIIKEKGLILMETILVNLVIIIKIIINSRKSKLMLLISNTLSVVKLNLIN